MTFSVSPLRLTREWRGQPTLAEPRWSRPGVCRSAFELLAYLRPEDCREALERLLLRPDPPDLKGRGRYVVQQGAEDRFRRWLPIRVRAIRARELAQLGLDEQALEPREVNHVTVTIHEATRPKFGEPCQVCDNREANHMSGARWLCCVCYVREGNAPADWHPLCVATKVEMERES